MIKISTVHIEKVRKVIKTSGEEKEYVVARATIPWVRHKSKILWIMVSDYPYPAWLAIAVPTSVRIRNGEIHADKDTLVRIAASMPYDICYDVFGVEFCSDADEKIEAERLATCEKPRIVDPWSGRELTLEDTCEIEIGMTYTAKADGYSVEYASMLDEEIDVEENADKIDKSALPESFVEKYSGRCDTEPEFYRAKDGREIYVVCDELVDIYRKKE